MKEKNFNQSLKNAVDDFETNSEITFNQERVWKNIKVKKRIIWFDILKVAAVILLFISFGIWFNSLNPIQSEKKQAKKNVIKSKLNPIENITIENPVVQTQPFKDTYVQHNFSLRNEKTFIKSENIITETKTFEPEVLKNLIIEDKQLIMEPLKSTPEIVYAVEFKRGRLSDKLEVQQKEEALIISFKKAKKSLVRLDTTSVIANSNTSNNIYKLKF